MGTTPADPRREPTAINEVPPYNKVTIGVRVLTTGSRLFEQISGCDYVTMRFRWSAYAQRDTYDTTVFALKGGSQKVLSGQINNEFLGQVVSQPQAVLVPQGRTYPTEVTPNVP